MHTVPQKLHFYTGIFRNHIIGPFSLIIKLMDKNIKITPITKSKFSISSHNRKHSKTDKFPDLKYLKNSDIKFSKINGHTLSLPLRIISN